jgi:urea transport system ATP-binding protein
MLTLEGVSAAYGLSRVLYGLNLDCGPGEAAVLLGRNGAGKTTLLRTIVGLHRVSEGKILFAGENVAHLPAFARARRGIGYVAQGRRIFPHLTVEENLRLGLAALGSRGRDAERSIPSHIYELFPALADLRARKGGVLSGGEQQQLAIGRALVTRPRLLILDEPTEGIQPSIVQQIEAALQTIRRELKIALLLAEQYLEFAWSVTDRFFVLRRGRLQEQGTTRDRDSDTVAHLVGI